MASAEREPINGVWGEAPAGSRGALVEAESLLALKCPQESHISRLVQVNKETRCLFAYKMAIFCIAQSTMIM